MTEAATEIGGLAALAGLLLLPGAAVASVAWREVPLLSLAFWLLSWTWLPPALGRERVLWPSLGLFALLALARVVARRSAPVRGESGQGAPRAGPSFTPAALALLAACALSRLLPLATAEVVPADRLAEHALAARLLAWHDGIPLSAEPLLPGSAFPGASLGLAGLSADLATLAGLPVHRGTALVAAVAGALLHLPLFALLAPGVGPGFAAVATAGGLVVALGADPAPQLATALALGAADLMRSRRGRPSAVAAGLLLGAAVAAHAGTALAAGVTAWVSLRAWPPLRAALGGERVGLALPVAVLGVAPLAWRVSGLAWLPDARLLLALVLAPVLAAGLGSVARRGFRTALVGAALAATVVRSAAFLAGAAGAPDLDRDDIAAMTWAAAHTGALDAVCGAGPAAAFIPAVAGRTRLPTPQRPCALVLVREPHPGAATGVVHRSGRAVVVAPRSPRAPVPAHNL